MITTNLLNAEKEQYMNQNNGYSNNKRTSSAITFIKKTLVVVVLPIITAIAWAIAGKIYEKKSSEAALAEKIADELDFINENRNLARVITEIKTTVNCWLQI